MSKTVKIMVITLLLGVSLVLSFSAGCTLGIRTSPLQRQGLAVVQEAWNIIFQDYVEQEKLDAEALSQGAIKGMLEAMDDPYTAYLNAETYQLEMGDIAGEFGGIGAYVGVKDEQIIIIAPFIDSPAARAGIMSGDIIMEIDGMSAAEMSPEEAALHIRGQIGTSVRLLVLHLGETEPREIEIVRAEIKVPTVHFEMKEDIAYISISSFSQRTNEELSPVMESLTQQGATGIILDLRSNLGGLLDTVVEVASHFLKEGVIVYVVDNQGEYSLSVKPQDIVTDLPLIVLTDNYSASGSEVLAGALQDYGRAPVAGTITYGKGSANSWYQLEDGSGLYITIARWLTPNRRLIEGKGIIPDYIITLKGDDIIQWAIDYLKGKQ
ncbi:MAG: S41 family peptidase [Dehalococcoidales bacterium]|nr:S41 family peptidase [Dehalococcoidales bacterium]